MEKSNATRVLWISRHQMTPGQLADLEEVLGTPAELTQWPDTVTDMAQLAGPVEDAQVICAVLPLDLMARLLELAGDRPVLRSVSAREPTGRVVTLPDGRTEEEFRFRHLRWEMILDIQVETVTVSKNKNAGG